MSTTDLCQIPECWSRWKWRVSGVHRRNRKVTWSLCVCDEHVAKWRHYSIAGILIEARQ